MTKSDLKDLMLVETRAGTRYIFINGKFRNKASYLYLDKFNKDLTYASNRKSLDIVKIYSEYDYLDYSTEYRKLLWERLEESPSLNQILQEVISTYGEGSHLDKAVEEISNAKIKLAQVKMPPDWSETIEEYKEPRIKMLINILKECL